VAIKANNTVIVNNKNELPKKKEVHKPIETSDAGINNKLNTAAKTELIKVNGSKKNWAKSDYYVDMLAKEEFSIKEK